MPTASLGQGVTSASIYTRDGRSELLALDGVSEVTWGRKGNAYSEASVKVLARLDKGCFHDLGEVHTWAHSLVLFRDSGDGIPERVWEGPVTLVETTTGAVTVSARDVSAWLTRRRIRTKRVGGKTEYGVLSEGSLIINRALSPDDPNVLPHLVTVPDPGEPTTTRDVKPNAGYAYDDLGSLAGVGLEWTVHGRSIILSTDNVLLGSTATLIPESHTTAELLISESGDDLATRVTAANEAIFGTAVATGLGVDGVSSFYGLHDMLTDALERKKEGGLTKVATRAVRRRYPAPQVVSFPEGSALDPVTPIPMHHLVPGVGVPVASEQTPKPFAATFVLTELSVKQDQSGEAVTVTLAPVVG